ncbi:MAG: hypothetical protein LBN42_03165 [Oscillospiraceae bacterium]|jgi:predicted nucleic acid-binding Zn ribbon protein|nr:hypothetical protein [Oscillospiraceae bacterium]
MVQTRDGEMVDHSEENIAELQRRFGTNGFYGKDGTFYSTDQDEDDSRRRNTAKPADILSPPRRVLLICMRQ